MRCIKFALWGLILMQLGIMVGQLSTYPQFNKYQAHLDRPIAQTREEAELDIALCLALGK